MAPIKTLSQDIKQAIKMDCPGLPLVDNQGFI
jgi:hypothetical protein